MVSLNDLTDETKVPDMRSVNLDDHVQYRKIKDWTGEIAASMIGNMQVHLSPVKLSDKTDIFYMTFVQKIFAVQLP